jgi:hypothetical protein
MFVAGNSIPVAPPARHRQIIFGVTMLAFPLLDRRTAMLW